MVKSAILGYLRTVLGLVFQPRNIPECATGNLLVTIPKFVNHGVIIIEVKHEAQTEKGIAHYEQLLGNRLAEMVYVMACEHKMII